MAIINTPLLGLPYAGADTDETYAVLAGLFVKDGQKLTLPEIIEMYTPTIGTVYIKAADWTAADGTADAYDAKITISGLESTSMILIYPATDSDTEKAKRLGIRAKTTSGSAIDDTFVIIRATGGAPTVTEDIQLVYIALRGYPAWNAGNPPSLLPRASVIGVDPYIATEEGDRDDIAASQRLVTNIAEGIRKSVVDLAKTAIDKTVNDLVNYYNKSQTLTKDEINALVSTIPKFSIEVVTALPTSNISNTTVYLVKSGDDDSNLYTEYIRANGVWEKLGTQTVDLTGYATEEWVNNLFESYVTTVNAAADRAEAAAERAEAAADRAEGADTAAYEPAETDLPRIYLEGDLPVNKTDDDKLMTMTYISKTARFFAYITAKVQGSGSTMFLKKNLTIKLFEDEARDEKMKVAFRNWPAKNKFVMKANFIDRTHARNVVSCRIFSDMVKSRTNFDSLPEPLRNSPNMGCVDGFPVKVFANGIYQGLYTLNIPKDDWMAGMDEKDDASKDKVAIICGEGISNSTTGQDGVKQVTFNVAYSDPSHIINGYDWSDEIGTVGATTRANFAALADLIVNGTDDEFKANISTYVDMESLIDAFLMTWLDCGGDSIGKNQFWLTYNAGLPWIIGQYDLDATWGGNASGSAWYAPETVFQDGYGAVTGHNGTKNMLYERLWANFTDDVRDRWNEVKHGALSLANIIQHFEAFQDPIPVELFAEDSAETTADGEYLVTIDSTHMGFDSVIDETENNIQQIRNFAAKRWAYVDGQINIIECTGITLSASTLSLTADNTTAALVATLSPEGCNQPVIWASSDEAVAKVSGGTVTGIYNGSCTITATCGAYSATCSVTVSGFTEAGSDNLADPTDSYWLPDYYYKDGVYTPVETDASVAGKYAVSNLIEIRAGDVIEIEGANAQYMATGGQGRIAFYKPDYVKSDPKDACYVPLNCYTIKNDYKGLTVSGDVTTYTFTADMLKKLVYGIEGFGLRGYIRLPLSYLDDPNVEYDVLKPAEVIIRRNPNGENAEAWA